MNAETPTVRELLREGEVLLITAGVPNATRNAQWILCDALGWTSLDVHTRSGERPTEAAAARFRANVRRRSRREPLQYILGSTEFMSLRFEVRPGVFVPRPDTEVLVEAAERRLRGLPLDRRLRVLDLCCGSGVIGVSLAVRIPNVELVAVDSSEEAVGLTLRNACMHGVESRTVLRCDDAAAFLAQPGVPPFTAVVCNPPYIASGDIPRLPVEVREHEPLEALDGGADGLRVYRALVPRLRDVTVPGGWVIFEIGDAQGGDVSAMLGEAGLEDTEIIRDLAGRDRVVAGVVPAT